MGAEEDSGAAVLDVRDLTVEVSLRDGPCIAVDGVSLTVDPGETLVILGESGSGKSLTAMAIMDLLPHPAARIVKGSVNLAGEDLRALPEEVRRTYRGSKIAMIFQDALSALNPVHTVGAQIVEVIREHSDVTRAEARERAVDLMNHVGIPAAGERYRDYPHQFSGGMRQRIMIAMAIAMNPSVLIADEPTTALDVTVQAQVLDLLERLQAEYHMGIILITHDLAVAAEVADRVAVMYAGKLVETGPANEVLTRPAHPYTAGLLDSIPAGHKRGEPLRTIAGSPPSLGRAPSGCPFRSRCPRAREACSTMPPFEEVLPGRSVACFFWEEEFGDRDGRVHG